MNHDLPSMENRHIIDKKMVSDAIDKIENNQNWSWIKELKKRIAELNRIDKSAIFYRGTEITYDEMFKTSNKIAKMLLDMGIKQGDEIPACISDTPELAYLLIAANTIGAKVNIFGPDFQNDYIDEILSSSGKKVIFVSDDNYFKISDNIKKVNYENKIIYSLADSLPKDKDGNSYDPYKEYDDGFYDFTNKIEQVKEIDNQFISMHDTIKNIPDVSIELADMNINDVFTITYSSGSTKIGKPKAIMHSCKGYLAMARFHDKDLSRTSNMKSIKTLSHIPPHSNTNLASSISDTLMQGGTVAFEPIYNEHFLGRSIVINKINLLTATKSHFVQTAKDFETDPLLKGKKTPYLLAPTAVGEGTTPGEEKFINKWLRKVKAGRDFLPISLTSCLSMAGGDCEHGGLFFVLFKQLKQKLNYLNLGKERQYGLVPFQLAKLAVLDQNGNECDYGKLGRLVANSPCTMVGYKNNEEANKNFYITDANGRKWADCKVWAYIDNMGNVHLKGRMGSEYITKDNVMIPEFIVADEILKDTKNIMSCEVVNVKDEKFGNRLVAHIELQPDRKSSIKTALLAAQKRCMKTLPKEVCDNLLFRIRSNKEAFPLTGCGKRAAVILEQEGISNNCLKQVGNSFVSVADLGIEKEELKSYQR